MRQFNNQQRWIDYLDAFVKVSKRIKDLNAEVYVMAGDIFDKYRPHPGILRRFLKELSGIDCPVILIKGNHDSPQIFYERFGGDTLHLVRDISNIIYLNRRNPTCEIDDVCFVGLGYTSYNVQKEILNLVKNVKTDAEKRIGIFHQLLDYPGIPEERADVSRSFMKNLGLDYVLMGHYHVAYEEDNLFNSGSPEYWSFDQAEHIEVNLDTDKETFRPAKKKGFYLIDTEKGVEEFILVNPARPMYSLTYESTNFDETLHLQRIIEHQRKYDIEGTMVKTIIRGKHKFGRINFSKSLAMEKPLLHIITSRLIPSRSLQEEIDVIKVHTEYLIERGIEKEKARKIAEWLENDKVRISNMQSSNILKVLRELIN
jgi:DNA repair exonuclease SbcCD nuclease subunit